MMNTGSLKVTTPTDREIAMTRVTTVFVEQGGKTTLTTTVLYDTKQIRDAVFESPMESGVAESFDKLAEPLATSA